MGFFEKRRIQKEIAELEVEQRWLKQRRADLQPAYFEGLNAFRQWAESVKRNRPDHDAMMRTVPKNPTHDEYTQICSRLADVEMKIEELKSKLA